jgi:hypothetical protein
VERTTYLVILARREGRDTRGACHGFTKKLWRVPAPLRKTLTYDRGKEMAEHERLAQRLSIQVFLRIRTARGNAAPTRTPTACCANTCPRARTCRAIPSASRTPLSIASISENVSIGPRHWRFLHNCVIIRLLPLQLETASYKFRK